MNEETPVLETENLETIPPGEAAASSETEIPFEISTEELLSDYQPLAQAATSQPEPTAGLTLEQIEQLLDRKLTAQEKQDYGEEELLSKKEVEAMLAAKEKEKFEKEYAEQMLRHYQMQALAVQMKYKDKLTTVLQQNGYDIEKDTQLRQVADDLFNGIVSQKAAVLGRFRKDSFGNLMPPVFTAPEMAQIVQEHSQKLFNNVLGLKKRMAAAPASLSPSVVATSSQPITNSIGDSEYESFLEKKKTGKASLSDAVKLLRSLPSQKK